MFGFGASSEGGFAGAGRVHTARSFVLSSILSRRQAEGHRGPRSVAVLHHQESAERIIGLAIEVHGHCGPGQGKPCRLDSGRTEPLFRKSR
jgi:hypothetical protein